MPPETSSSIASFLRSQSERVLTYTAIDFEPSVGYLTKLAAAADAVQARYKAPHWSGGGPAYVLRKPADGAFLLLSHNRLAAQTLGLEYWTKRYQEYSELFQIALKEI